MPVIACPSCGGRTPRSAISCVHCGTLAPACSECTGSGSCPACGGKYPDILGCERCSGNGHCPACGGGKRAWPPSPPPAGS